MASEGASFGIVVNDHGIQKLLAKAAKNGRDMSPAMKAIAEDLRLHVDEAFRTEGRSTGEAWEPLAQSTLDRRRKGRKTAEEAKILVDRKFLRNSITRDNGAKRHGKHEAAVGTNEKYAPTHQFGQGNVPARPFLVHTPEEIKDIEQTLLDFIAQDW